MSVTLVQGNCTLRPSGSLESVIPITSRLSSLNLGPKRSKEQAQVKRKKGEREKKRKVKKKSHEKLYNQCCKILCDLFNQFSTIRKAISSQPVSEERFSLNACNTKPFKRGDKTNQFTVLNVRQKYQLQHCTTKKIY